MTAHADPEGESGGISPPNPGPTRERILALDVVRGFAVLGILLMNISSFAIPEEAMERPWALGGTWLDAVVWWLTTVFFEGKMRALFSMLFGAGVILFTLERPSQGESVADLYYRRILWLAVIGFLHGKFLWEGDILFIYGMVGLVLFVFRNLKPGILIALGLGAMWWNMADPVWSAMELLELRSDASQAMVIREKGGELTTQEEEYITKWEEKLKGPSLEDMEEEIRKRRGGYWSNYSHRAALSAGAGFDSMADIFLDAAMAMFLGMGLYKKGFFTGKLPRNYYLLLMILSYGFGIPITAWLAGYQLATNFNPGDVDLFQALLQQPTRIAIALGHASAIMLLLQSGIWPRFMARMASVGRMALTNYLFQTLICTTLFYGYGLGWFGYLNRIQLLLVVFAVWALETAWSQPWLSRFHFGPAEWLWRWLTYLQKPPFLRDSPSNPGTILASVPQKPEEGSTKANAKPGENA